MSRALLALPLRGESDVVLARQRARQLAALLGFDVQDGTRIATAVSEVARNAFRYAGGGRVEFRLEGPPWTRALEVCVSDDGPGIADLQAVLDGSYVSRTGMGAGLAGTRRLMDRFAVESAPGKGTVVTFARALPPNAPPPDAGVEARIVEELARQRPGGPSEEGGEQNRELLRALAELRTRQEELLRLNRELEDTNRGVVALYAELDDRVDQLRRANSLRAQFLSYMSHEFRTPLDSVLALSGLLLDRVDGELTEEQEKQVVYIRKSARDLLNLVDDLLDTARVEAGKVAVRAEPYRADDLFNALRATLRPLLVSGEVSLVFDDVAALPPLVGDEAKVSQVLRNFVSNALKFTEAGEVRVSAAHNAESDEVEFRVADTGIGIAEEDQERVFQDFTQVDGVLQRRVRGTGLGLPLSRKLAELLEGRVWVRSAPGEGSTFFLRVPREWRGDAESGTDDENDGA